MIILGILGSPRVKGICARLLDAALEGAAGQGATVKRFDLIKLNIQHCLGCCKCLFDDPSLPQGRCPLKDDMAGVLEEYGSADGYIMASPVYDGSVTALMKKFIERKIALTHRSREAVATIGAARVPADFKKAVAMIVTGNCAEEYRELMGDPCFEMMEGHFMIEQVITTDKLYVGGVENMPENTITEKCDAARRVGARLVEEITKSQS
jgi:multimeric flavodoxin WrbA